MNAIQKFISAVNDTGSKQWALILVASFIIFEFAIAVTSNNNDNMPEVFPAGTTAPVQTPTPSPTSTAPVVDEVPPMIVAMEREGDPEEPYYCSGCSLESAKRKLE